MAKRTLEFTTEELHRLHLMVKHQEDHLPDQTLKERVLLIVLGQKLFLAYVEAAYEDSKTLEKDDNVHTTN